MPDDLKEKLKENKRIRFRAKIVPNSSSTEFAGMLSDLYKIRVSAPAEKNKANVLLLKYLCREFGVPPYKITITSGKSSSQKTINIQL